MTVGASRGLEFNLNPTVIRDRVAALRVRVGTVKGLRRKDKHVFARMIFGSVTRETEARKRKSAEKRIDLNQEVIFQGEEVGGYTQTGDSGSSSVECLNRSYSRLSSVIPNFASSGSSSDVPMRSSIPAAPPTGPPLHSLLPTRIYSVVTPTYFGGES